MYKVVFKYIKGYKKNTVVCILGIAFSVMLIFSLVGLSERIMNQYKEMMTQISEVFDIKIFDVNSLKTDEIYNDELKENCSKMKCKWSGTLHSGNEVSNTYIIGVEGQWETFYKTEIIEGRTPDEKYEICVDEKYARENNLKLSDEINTQIYDDEGNDTNVILKVTGIVKEMTLGSSQDIIFTSYKTAEDLCSNKEFVLEDRNTILVRYSEDTYETDKIINLRMALAQKYGLKFPAQHIEENDEKAELYEDSGVYSSIGYAFYGVCGVVFICMVIFIYNTISISMTEKIRQYGMLRCIGMDNNGMVKLMLAEEVVYCFGGLLFGILGGNILNSIIADKIVSCFVQVESTDNKESAIVYIITICVTLIAVIIASISMNIKLSKKHPLELIRYMEKAKNIKAKKKYKSLLLGMANRNIKRSPSKSTILVSTIFIATLLITIIGNVFTSINFNINKTPSGFAQYEIDSSLASQDSPYITVDTVKKLDNDSDIKEIYWQRMEYGYEISVDEQSKERIKCVLVYSDNLMKKFMEYNNIEGMDLNGNIAIIAGNDYDDVKKVHLSSSGEIYGCTEAKKECDIDISKNVKQSINMLQGHNVNNSECIIINESMAKEVFGDVKDYTSIYIKTKTTFSINELKEAMGIKDYSYISLDDSNAYMQSQLIGIMIMGIYMMVSVIVLNVFIISNIVKTSVALRVREIGMLRSIGAEKKWIEKSICYEIMILTIKGIILGIVAATPISVYVYNIVNEEMGIGYGGYIVSVVVILTGSFFMSELVVKKCMNSKIINMIKSE